MKPSLGTAWEIRIRQGRAYLYRRRDDRHIAVLTAAEAIVLGLMDGFRSLEDVKDILTQSIGSKGAVVINSLIMRLGPLLVDGQPRKVPYSLETLAKVAPPAPSNGTRPLPGPRVLHWWVTNYCPRRCAYCFAKPISGNQAIDAIINRAQLEDIFREATELGAQSLLVAGAEPLLREDLPEVMGDAMKYGINPLLTTKYPITRTLADRFAEAGVRHISLSVDTLSVDENQTLIGSTRYAEQVKRSVSNLKNAGVAFSIQAVVTAVNVASIPSVAEFAADAGAEVMQIVPFERVMSPVGLLSNSAIGVANSDYLDQQVDLLARRFPRLKVKKFERIGTGSRSAYHCDIGITKLFFLPNGIVHRCHKLISDQHLQGKDLRQVSVASAWHDTEYREVIAPPRSAYKGSDCYRCGSFSNCHQYGRCIYQAWVLHKRYTDRDRMCTSSQ